MALLYPRMLQRPELFALNPASPLASGLVFAGLGGGRIVGARGTTLYQDASVYGNHGTLTGYSGAGDTPADKWQWDSYLRRFPLGFDATNDYVAVSAALGSVESSSKWTISLWHNSTAPVSFGGLVQFGNIGIVQTYFARYGVLRGVGPDVVKRSSTTISPAVWSHVCASAVGSVSGNPDTNTLLYINGLEESGGYYGDTGYGARSTIGMGYAACNGSLADVCVWSRALSPGEIEALADHANVDLRIGSTPLILPTRQRFYGVGVAGEEPEFSFSSLSSVSSLLFSTPSSGSSYSSSTSSTASSASSPSSVSVSSASLSTSSRSSSTLSSPSSVTAPSESSGSSFTSSSSSSTLSGSSASASSVSSQSASSSSSSSSSSSASSTVSLSLLSSQSSSSPGCGALFLLRESMSFPVLTGESMKNSSGLQDEDMAVPVFSGELIIGGVT